MLPAGMIERTGLTLRELASRTESPDPDEIGYLFTEDDKNSVIWLYKGWIEAAATDPSRFAELERARPGAFRAIATSIEVPRQVGAHAGDLDPALAERPTEVLVAMNETEAGRETLFAFNETERFDMFPDGVSATFGPIYELLIELEELGII